MKRGRPPRKHEDGLTRVLFVRVEPGLDAALEDLRLRASLDVGVRYTRADVVRTLLRSACASPGTALGVLTGKG